MATLGALLWDFNPRSPHRERPCGNGFSGDDLAISIHAPLTGSDDWQAETSKSSAISIHAPLTGSDDWRQVRRIRWNISIHAPLTGSDLRNLSIFNRIPNFNPRSPHRERPSLLFRCPNLPYFNPRSPHRERLFNISRSRIYFRFQSTLPSQGATPFPAILCTTQGYFNPRSPHRERRQLPANRSAQSRFQSTLPSQGATANIHIKFLCDLLFSTLSSKISLLFRVFHR